MTLPTAPVLVPNPSPSSNRFFCDSDGNRWDGVISIYGINLPVGVSRVSRVLPDGTKGDIRGGYPVRTDYDFVLSDTEAPFNVESSYVLSLNPDTRAVFYNWFTNPSFEHTTPTSSYTTTANRSLAGKTVVNPDALYRDKVMAVSGYSGVPVIGTTIPTVSRTNLFIRPSFEDGLATDFGISNGTLSVLNAITPPSGGTKALQAAFTAAGAVTVGSALRVPVTVGEYYQLSFYFRIAGTFTGAGTTRPDVYFRDAANAQVGALASGAIVTGTSTWQRLTVTAQAPDNAATLNVQLACSLVGNAQFDAIMVEKITDPAALPGVYFDGNTAPIGIYGHAWTGTANVSTSTEGALFPVSTNAQRLLMFTRPDTALVFNKTYSYKVTGRVNVLPRVFSWADARSDPTTLDPIGTMTSPPARNWDDPLFDSGGHTWSQVLGYTADDGIVRGTLWVGLVDSTGALISGASLVQAAQIVSSGADDWYDFEAVLRVPDVTLPTIYIGFFQGDGTMQALDPTTGQPIIVPDSGEFQRNWVFDALMLDGPYSYDRPFAAPGYFDGETVFDPNIHGIGYTQQPLDPDTFGWDQGDAIVEWTGVPDASASKFTGASKLGAYTSGCLLAAREDINGHNICEPVFISDPIIPSLSSWLGLLSIAPLVWAPRRELVDVLGRHAPVALSQFRSTPSTEFRLMTSTLEERKKFLEIINSGRIVLLRNPDPSYPETNWYISIGDVSEERIITDHRDPRRRWVVSAQVVDRPSTLLTAVNGQAWQNVRDTYENWAAVDEGNDSWLNVLIGPAALPDTPLALNALGGSGAAAPAVWEPVP